MKKYNKLVRDNIPEIIKASGKECDFIIAEKHKHMELLEDKLHEEVAEYVEDKNLEELCDVMEVLFALAEGLGFSEKELMEKREEKKLERGSFKKGIVLKEVREK